MPRITLISLTAILLLCPISCKDDSNPADTTYSHDVDTALIKVWDLHSGGSTIDSAIVFTADNLYTTGTPLITNISTFITAKAGQVYFEINGNTDKIYQYDYTLSGDTLFLLGETTATATNPTAITANVMTLLPH